jgi:hypothetical protein
VVVEVVDPWLQIEFNSSLVHQQRNVFLVVCSWAVCTKCHFWFALHRLLQSFFQQVSNVVLASAKDSGVMLLLAKYASVAIDQPQNLSSTMVYVIHDSLLTLGFRLGIEG